MSHGKKWEHDERSRNHRKVFSHPDSYGNYKCWGDVENMLIRRQARELFDLDVDPYMNIERTAEDREIETFWDLSQEPELTPIQKTYLLGYETPQNNFIPFPKEIEERHEAPVSIAQKKAS